MQPAETEPEPSEAVAKPEPSALRVACWGTGGAALALALHRTIAKTYEDGHFTEFALAIVLGAIFMNVVEPQIRRRLGADHAAPASSHPVRRTLIGGVLLGVPLVLLFELLHAGLHDAGAYLTFTVPAFLTCGSITYLWARGARQRRPLAARDGALGGFLVGYAVPSLAIVISGGAALPSMTQGFGDVGDLPGPDAVYGILLMLLGNAAHWAFLGLLGGAIIDARRLRRPTLGITGALVVGAAVPAWLVSYMYVNPVVPFEQGVSEVVRSVGWGLGLFVCPIADETFTVERPNRIPLYLSGVAVAVCLVLGLLLLTSRAASPPTVLFQENFRIREPVTLKQDCQRVSRDGFVVKSTGPRCSVDVDRAFPNGIQIDLAIRLESGADNTRLGLKFARAAQPTSFHVLTVTRNGKYGLWSYDASRKEPWTDLLGTKDRPAVTTPQGGVTLLQIALSGSRIRCAINGHEVCSYSGGGKMEGAIGIFLDEGAEVKFESLRVIHLAPSGPAARPPLEAGTASPTPGR